MEEIKHFTSTAIIVHNNKALLHLHKKLNIWLPVGGHIKDNESPDATALREAKEESGLDIKLYSPDKPIGQSDAKQLIPPMHILLEDINDPKGFHQHIDLIYYATSDSDTLNPQSGETNNLGWFDSDEIQNLQGVPDNVKIFSSEAIKIFGNS